MEVQYDCRTEKTEKCTRQSALIAAKNVQFHSNPMEADQYTAENAILNEDHPEDIKLTSQNLRYVLRTFLFFSQ